MLKKIAVGSDHAGYDLKQKTIEYLQAKDFEIFDAGTGSKESCNYPEFAQKVADAVACDEADMGVLICGTGIGMSMAANRNPKVRAALCSTMLHARMARRHNNANILCMGARITGLDLALAILEEFLANEFEGGRHDNRVKMF